MIVYFRYHSPLNIEGVVVSPGENHLTSEQWEKVKNHPQGQRLKKKFSIVGELASTEEASGCEPTCFVAEEQVENSIFDPIEDSPVDPDDHEFY